RGLATTTAFIVGLPLSGDERRILRREDRVLVCSPAGARGCGVRPTRTGSATGAAGRGLGGCLRRWSNRAGPGGCPPGERGARRSRRLQRARRGGRRPCRLARRLAGATAGGAATRPDCRQASGRR